VVSQPLDYSILDARIAARYWDLAFFVALPVTSLTLVKSRAVSIKPIQPIYYLMALLFPRCKPMRSFDYVPYANDVFLILLNIIAIECFALVRRVR
jgi:hypothetical protein